jgi:N,N'-diacetylchitobiose phosphorylase
MNGLKQWSMQYGYFDDRNKEYVIMRPDTPKSWSNYLGSKEFGSIITNNAGGYTFYKSGGMGRFIRMRFNSIPMDQPGRYIYFHDHNSGDYWSASWQPVGKPLDQFKSQCCHGTAYTRITSEYKGITSQVTYFVPLNSLFEIWRVKITNTGAKKRTISGFTYQELVGTWNSLDDLLNLQYVQYTAKMNVADGIIDHGTNVNIPEMPDNFEEKDQGRHTFQALAGVKVIGYDTDREAFLGPYRTYANPLVVEKGKCTNSLAYGDNPCGSLQFEIVLEPGESKDFLVLVGIGRAGVEGKKIAAEYATITRADEDLARLKEYWHDRIKGITADTPDPLLNSMVNMWSIYNCMITFAWSRAASLIYTASERDGLGYRDTVQDFLGPMHAITDEVKERLELMITGQVSTGGAMPVVRPLSHKPGSEKAPAEDEYRSDDCLWLFNAVPAYVKESGDLAFYEKVLPYADKGEDTVLGHLKRAIKFNMDRSGKHGLPCGLRADWNDCLRFGHNGESVFVAMQLRLALKVYIEIAQLLNQKPEEVWGEVQLLNFDSLIQKHAWDGEWFMRGYRFDGMKFGSKDSQEGQIYLNPQAWAIIGGAATKEQAEISMKQVNKHLATEFGIALCNPPYTSSDFTIVRAQLMNPGTKENGGIFVHIQGWAVMAEAILGHGNQAYKYLKAYLPSSFNDKAEVREIEPYVLCQSTHSNYSPNFGKSRIPWLSGSATWTYYAITQYILGIRPDYHGIIIDPCIPADWKGFRATRKFRGMMLDIEVKNENGKEKGVSQIILNGDKMIGIFIPVNRLKAENSVTVIM